MPEKWLRCDGSVLLVQVSPAPASSPTSVTVAGEIDIASAPRLRERLLALPDGGTILELSGVLLLSAAGATELVDQRDRLGRAGAPLALAGARPPVRRVLTITGIAETVDDAARLITAGRPPGSDTAETLHVVVDMGRRVPRPQPDLPEWS